MTSRSMFALAACLVLGNKANAQGTRPARDVRFDVPMHVETPASVTVFRGDDGKRYLAYHLIVSNWAYTELVFDRIDILDAANSRVLMSYDTVALARSATLRVSITEPARPETQRHLPAGRIAVLRTWFVLDEADHPQRLVHRFSFAPNPALQIARAQQDTDAVLVLTAAAVPVDERPPIVIAPPLRGGPWRAGGGASPVTYHLGGAILDGRFRIPERFAIDFQKVDSAGSILPNPFPNIINNEMFYSNRAEVLAVGDGEIVLVRDGLIENVPTASGFENMKIPLTRESSAGNQIGLKLADGKFAQYAHLAPGTIRVKVGQRVHRGDVIANVGNAGSSKNPHLHFAVADGPEIAGSQGIAWVFDGFELWGHQSPKGMPDIKATPVPHRLEMLLQDAVVRFR